MKILKKCSILANNIWNEQWEIMSVCWPGVHCEPGRSNRVSSWQGDINNNLRPPPPPPGPARGGQWWCLDRDWSTWTSRAPPPQWSTSRPSSSSLTASAPRESSWSGRTCSLGPAGQTHFHRSVLWFSRIYMECGKFYFHTMDMDIDPQMTL